MKTTVPYKSFHTNVIFRLLLLQISMDLFECTAGTANASGMLFLFDLDI